MAEQVVESKRINSSLEESLSESIKSSKKLRCVLYPPEDKDKLREGEIIPGLKKTETLYRGFRADVVSVTEERTGEHFAMKLYKPVSSGIPDKKINGWFLRELSVFEINKGNPFAVQGYQQGLTPEGRRYIVMELIDFDNFVSLEDLSQPDKPTAGLSPVEREKIAVMIMDQLAKLVLDIRAHGWIWTDIREDNVTWGQKEEQIKAYDFGMSWDAKRLNRRDLKQKSKAQLKGLARIANVLLGYVGKGIGQETKEILDKIGNQKYRSVKGIRGDLKKSQE